MEIDRAGADGAAAGQRDPRLAHARDQRAEHEDRGAHLAHDVVGRLGVGDRAAERERAAVVAQRLDRDAVLGAAAWPWCRCRRAAARWSASAAPRSAGRRPSAAARRSWRRRSVISPDSGRPPRMRMRSIALASRSHARQRDAALAHVFAGLVGVAGLAGLVALQEQELADAFAGVDLAPATAWCC